MTKKNLTPHIAYQPELDIAALDWSHGVNRIYFQTSRVKLTAHADGHYGFELRDRKHRTEEFPAGSIVEAQISRLGTCLGYDMEQTKRSVVNEKLKCLSTAEVHTCLEEVANWYTNRVQPQDLPSLPPAEEPGVNPEAIGKKSQGIRGLLQRVTQTPISGRSM